MYCTSRYQSEGSCGLQGWTPDLWLSMGLKWSYQIFDNNGRLMLRLTTYGCLPVCLSST